MKDHHYTITEVAKMLQVSPSTVSRAMNNSPGVSSSLRKKILDFVEEIGYQPNTLAQSLSRGRSPMIALILGDIRNPFYADLAFGIQKGLETYGYIVTTFNSEYDYQKEIQFIHFAQQYHYSGIILVTVNSQEADSYLNQIKIPLLLVNRMLPHYKGSYVVVDNFQAGYMAARHLISLGHTRIGFLAGNLKHSTASAQRFAGYQQALSNYQLTCSEQSCLFDLDWKLDTGYEAAKTLSAAEGSPFPCTAYLISNDLLALGFMDYCKEHHISIPEELSIISFDDISYGGLRQIQLTTVSQHAQLMSEQAAQLMYQMLKEPEMEPVHIILEPTLILRDTTGPA